MIAKWCFPSSNKGEKRGFNDSGIETFRDNPIKSLAREICQNSLDAVLPNKTAIVEFSTFLLKNDCFPDKDGFKDILTKCLDYCRNDKTQKASTFFKRAIDYISRPLISMLRISDFNTTGLKGRDWNNLIEKSGASEKSENKGGSFGIGKNAPFACSDFRTVFYSTLDMDNNQRCKGVSRLMSFKLGVNADNSDNISQGTGYYGVETDFAINHLEEMIKLDSNFTRTTSGTDIFVSALNMTDSKDFQASVIAEVLEGFLMAIWQEKLEVRVNNFLINKSTLDKVFEEYADSINDNTIKTYKLLSNGETVWHTLPIYLSKTMYLGDIKFAFNLIPDGTNKVSMFRSSGMKIIDKGNLCPSLRYVGLAIIEGSALNNFLRDLENPSHNKWEPHRSDNPSVAKNVLKDIYNSMYDKLNEEAMKSFEDEIDIDGAGDYLPDEIDDSGEEKPSEKKESLNKIVDVQIKVLEKAKSSAMLESDEFGDDLESEEDSEGSQVEGEEFEGYKHFDVEGGEGHKDKVPVGVDVEGDNNGKKIVSVKAKDIRIFCLNKNEKLYRLIFTPTTSSIKGYIALYKLAEQNDKMPLQVVYVKNPELECKNNKIAYFKFEEGVSNSVDIKIEEQEYLTMEVRLYAYKG